jgi:hypothetical protein
MEKNEPVEKEFELAVLNFGEPTKRFHEYRRHLLAINPDIPYLLETVGFTKLGERENNRDIYELDIASADLQMLRLYKKAFAEYKQRQGI